MKHQRGAAKTARNAIASFPPRRYVSRSGYAFVCLAEDARQRIRHLDRAFGLAEPRFEGMPWRNL
jgi:hypothetical protein